MSTLSHEQARRVYNRIGAWQDSQAFYEDAATGLILRHGQFVSAERIFEFGCGTGRFASRLLAEHLPPTAHYRGVDVSPVMADLARDRLACFGARAEVVLTDGGLPEGEPDAAYDRFVSTYVLDLLSEEDILGVLREAHRMLRPGGLLCLSSLSMGCGLVSRIVSRVWSSIHALSASAVGGCRPLDLARYVPDRQWTLRHHTHLTPFGVPSEVVIAEPR